MGSSVNIKKTTVAMCICNFNSGKEGARVCLGFAGQSA